MKRKIFITTIALLGSLLLLAFSDLFLPRIFEGREGKTLRAMQAIIHDYVSPKSDDVIDFVRHTFRIGSYEYKNDRLIMTYAMKTGMELSDALSSVGKMNIVLEEYIRQNEILSDEDTEIVIRFECRADWSMTLMPKTKSIMIGVSSHAPFSDEILGHCKEYESIHIGGYWGYDVIVPDDIDSSFFADFTNLKCLDVDSIATQSMKETLDNALKGLPESCMGVKTEVSINYSAHTDLYLHYK